MKTLDGTLVVSLEQAVAAPFCSMRLADAGATVLKVERPEGDFARGYDDAAAGQSSYFVWLNRGKQSWVLDLSADPDRRRLASLLARADIFLQNLKPGAAARLGFDPAELRRRHPRLICCSISGYGETGPLADRKAYDLLIQAEVGLASITGGAEGPARVGVSVVDIATGATAYGAILEALIRRGISGQGADIRLSMFDVMAEWMAVPLLNAEAGRPPGRMGLRHPSIAPYGVFSTAAGSDILISIQSEREWQWLCQQILDTPWAIDDPRFRSNVARVQHRDQTDALVQAGFARHRTDALAQRLQAANLAFALVNDLQALAAHPHLRRTPVALADGQQVALPAVAARVDGQEARLGPVPALGAVDPALVGDGEGDPPAGPGPA